MQVERTVDHETNQTMTERTVDSEWHRSTLMHDLASAVLLLLIDMEKNTFCKGDSHGLLVLSTRLFFSRCEQHQHQHQHFVGLKRLTPTILCMLCVIWVLQISTMAEVMNSFNAYFFLVIRARSRLPAHVVSIYETQNWSERSPESKRRTWIHCVRCGMWASAQNVWDFQLELPTPKRLLLRHWHSGLVIQSGGRRCERATLDQLLKC